MNAVDIIREKVSPDGFPVERKVLQEAAAREVSCGEALAFQYGNVVFTVGRNGVVHLYSMGRPGDLLRALRKFHRDVWWLSPWPLLRAPIRLPELQRIAVRFGWKKATVDALGYTWFTLQQGN